MVPLASLAHLDLQDLKEALVHLELEALWATLEFLDSREKEAQKENLVHLVCRDQ